MQAGSHAASQAAINRQTDKQIGIQADICQRETIMHAGRQAGTRRRDASGRLAGRQVKKELVF